jgi:hypothetical protein
MARRAGEGVAPEEVHALAAMQVEEFVGVDADGFGIIELGDFLQGAEVDVVGAVDGLWDTEDEVGDWHAAA